MTEFLEATIHGRFQPPLHENHWAYVEAALGMAEHVEILITNPFSDEAFEPTAAWRNDPENNPFTYEERVAMFGQFLTAMGVSDDRYSFRPFNIKDHASFKTLDPRAPNIINVYSDWSTKKARFFEDQGLKVTRLAIPKQTPGNVSGSDIRKLIHAEPTLNKLPKRLTAAGFMPKAIPGLMDILQNRATTQR